MFSGYTGKILTIDLSTRKHSVTEFKSNFAKKYLGGNGFGIHFLLKECPANIDPLSPENPFIIALGPFARTIIPTSDKYSVFAKSPLTGLIGEGYASGSFGGELRSAGYDVVIIRGRNDSLGYLWIDDDNVNIVDASELAGLDTWTVEKIIKENISDPHVKVASIGIAGEKMVKFACITNDRSRQVGRTGLGAVLGSKNLKAIALRGSGPVNVANPDRLVELCTDLNKRCQGDSTKKYRNYGTPTNLLAFNELGCLPTRNFQQATFEQAEKVSGKYLFDNYVKRIVSCCSCPIACDHIAKVETGKFKSSEVGVDYETIYALGPNLGIGNLEAVIRANELCDRLGIDTMSAGGTIAFAMECYERGIFTDKDTGGLELKFGNSDALIEIIEKISRREGIGNVLAEGSKKAAVITGNSAEKYSMTIKGLELPGYDIRGLKTAALGFATSSRGGCHLRSGSYGPDIKGSVDRYKEEYDRGNIVKEREDLYSIFDSLILCKFIRSTVKEEELAELYNLVTGIEITFPELLVIGERIYNLEKIFNLREGATRKDDLLPERMYTDPIPDGPAKGSFVSKEGYNTMLNGYYDARGWNSEGIPTAKKLKELDILDHKIERE